MDKRYKKNDIFFRRSIEWDKDRIKRLITEIFENVSLINNWTFEKCDWINSHAKRLEELKYNIYSILRATLKNGNTRKKKDLNYDIKIPDIIENHFFYIGGYLKIPIFQLYDFPIIYRNGLLKLRTNTINIELNLNNIRDRENYIVTLFNKKISLALLLSTFHTKEEIEEFIAGRPNNQYVNNLIVECKKLYDISKKERTTNIGKLYSSANIDKYKKGKSVLFSLKAAYEIDIFSKKLMKTESILFELLQGIYDGSKSDKTFKRKRIRLSEYILFPLVKKFYDMIVTINNDPKNTKFKINKNIILDGCNVSSIVHFNFPINPVTEIASMCQLSLTGPGGFKKENVPNHLRDIHHSQFGYVCPADTPDREGCGVILNMIPTIDIGENGIFGTPDQEVITSYPISLVPFLKNDDQIRLQMASNQLKQSIILKDSEKPFIRSGLESMNIEHTTFTHIAKNDGAIVHANNKFVIAMYVDKTSEVININYRNMYQNTVDYIKCYYKVGEEFKKGDILCESITLDNGELKLGHNLLTGIAIWKGWNYEDGIVISESTRKKFTSLHSIDLTFSIEPGQVLLSLIDEEYMPLFSVGDKLKKGQIYARVKTIDDEDGFESINIEPFEPTAPVDCTITDIEIYPNSWNKQIKEFHDFIERMMITQTDNYIQLYSRLERFMDNKDDVNAFVTKNGLSRLDCVNQKGKYAHKGKRFGGILVKMQAVYEQQIGEGDKVANRHGNKGIISRIIPDNKMPKLPDGRNLDIIINPLGIISRMNIGQLYELHMSECLHQLKLKLKEIDGLDDKLELLDQVLDIIDKTDDEWIKNKIRSEFIENYNNNNDPEENLYFIQPPFQSISIYDLFNLMFIVDSEFRYEIFDPETGMNIKRFIVSGYIFFTKLIHRSSEKMAARSIGPYSKKTLQPLGGKSRSGGHRFGEMETWALLAHGGTNFLRDLLTVQSDSPGLKNKLLTKDILNNPSLSDDSFDDRPQSMKLLEAYLDILGLKIKN